MTAPMHDQRNQASNWFVSLKNQIVQAFEDFEDSQTSGPFLDREAGRFDVTETTRQSEDGTDAGGGVMSVMRGGRVFEKVGVNVSTVFGVLGESAQKSMTARGVPGLDTDARFWASGISLVAHLQNPHMPAVHMNTRMFWTPQAWWFGGGADLNPCIEYEEDTAHFHQTLKSACDQNHADYYDRFKAWADEYFYVPHRGRARGVGGIFYDDLNSGNWADDFAFTQDVGRAFLPAYLPLLTKRRNQEFTQKDKDTQLIHRGLYAEYNLVYDRGTKFGLASGHDANAVLMSLPPMAKWA